MERRLGVGRRILFIAALSVLLVVGCTASPVANPPRERPTAVAPLAPTLLPPPLPSPVPTAKAPPPNLYVRLSPDPLHGAPPLTAKLTVDLYGSEELLRACTRLHWELGDGTTQEMPCTTGGDHPLLFSLAHNYEPIGTYYARVTAMLQDGQSFESNTQTIVVATPQSISLAHIVIYWGLWGLTILAAILAVWFLRRLATRARRMGYVALGLVTFVPPFSYLPNPVGLIWGRFGNYSYDPRLPFVNRLVIADEPTSYLRPYLDALIGQTGLDPLDPVHPLASYEFVEMHSPGLYGAILVSTRLTYDNGNARTYDVPLYQFSNFFGFYQIGWRYDGLGRLRTEHRELPGTPFGNANSPVRLATPKPLSLNAQAQQLDARNLGNWGPVGYANQRLVWSPQGDAFLRGTTSG